MRSISARIIASELSTGGGSAPDESVPSLAIEIVTDRDPRTVLEELREGLNSAYRQLRELLTTFRLRIEGEGLAGLKRLGFGGLIRERRAGDAAGADRRAAEALPIL